MAGTMAASYIGGSMNYAAVGEALEVESSLFLAGALAEVIIASNACAAGPTTAAALAASKGWRTLVTPAIMLGVFGYVVANFVGVFLGGWLG